MKFYDSPLFSCLLLGEQSNWSPDPFLASRLWPVFIRHQYFFVDSAFSMRLSA